MKRTEKKKLVLTKRDLRVLVLTPSQLQHAAGASGNQGGGCGGSGATTHAQR